MKIHEIIKKYKKTIKTYNKYLIQQTHTKKHEIALNCTKNIKKPTAAVTNTHNTKN